MNNKETADKIFECLRTIIYEPQEQIDVDGLPEEFEDVAEGLKLLHGWLKEQKKFATDLGNGDLSTPTPNRENVIVQPLKLLQSNLNHLTWQTQEVAKGDYAQQLDFMGDFSVAFNTMIKQLKQRRDKLNEDMEIISKRNKDLNNMRRFLTKLMDGMQNMVCVLDEEKKIRYENNPFRELSRINKNLYAEIFTRLIKFSDEDFETMELKIEYDKVGLREKDIVYIVLEKVAFSWMDRTEYAYVIHDITKEKEKELHIESLAYRDELTGLYNRHYGMMELSRMLETNKPFCLCFIDLDNLKYVNDNLGHKSGDAYIFTTVESLEGVPEPKFIARIGGDELMVVVEGITKETLTNVLEKIRAGLGDIVTKEGEHHKKSFSYGIVESEAGTSAKALLREADILMYEYKYAHKTKIPGARS